MINPWFKFYGGEYLSDPKIGSLTPQERSCWMTLLCMSGTSSTGGLIEYLTVEVLLEKSGIKFDPYHPEEWNACLSILVKLERLKMIKTFDDGIIEIINWKKRQETNLTDAERAKSYRDRKKERHENVTRNVTNVTQEENRIEENRIYTTSSIDDDGVGIYSKQFLSFWSLYPNKKGKGNAWKVWKKIKSVNSIASKIIDSVEEHKTKDPQWKKDDGQYIPHPATFLNQSRWEDEILIPVEHKIHKI